MNTKKTQYRTHKLINLPIEIYEELKEIKIIKEEPFGKVIRRLIEVYKKNKK